MNRKNLRLLLIDDDATDRELFIDAVDSIGSNYVVASAAEGNAALQYLQQTALLPHLIVLDLNMPIKDGRETLKELKGHDLFKSVPVCILSTSNAHFDVKFAYEEGASLFLVKPLEFSRLITMLTSLLTFFDNYVTLIDRKA